MRTTRVLVMGGGKIGQAIVTLLRSTGDYEVTSADHDGAALAPLAAAGVSVAQVEVEDHDALPDVVGAHDVVVNAMPFYCAETIARAACLSDTHYFDLTEDVAAK